MRFYYYFASFATIFYSIAGYAKPPTVYLRNDSNPAAETVVSRETTICLESLDYNPEDRLIGHIKNGYGVPFDSVYAENSVEQWVNIGIRNGLTVRGTLCKRTVRRLLW